MSPRSTAPAMSGEVRNGTMGTLIPAVLANSSAARFCVLPGLMVPDRKSTRLNSSHRSISYAVFCLKKKINHLSSSEKEEKHTHIHTHTPNTKTHTHTHTHTFFFVLTRQPPSSTLFPYTTLFR